jgi:hypothetical protein
MPPSNRATVRTSFRLMASTLARSSSTPPRRKNTTFHTDELQEEIGFARYMRDLHNQTGDWEKSLAMFDGDTHVSGDEKTYGGDWKRGAKPETLNYLDYFKTHGVDLSDGAAVRTAGSKAYKSPATADGGQANPGYNFTLPKPASRFLKCRGQARIFP